MLVLTPLTSSGERGFIVAVFGSYYWVLFWDSGLVKASKGEVGLKELEWPNPVLVWNTPFSLEESGDFPNPGFEAEEKIFPDGDFENTLEVPV